MSRRLSLLLLILLALPACGADLILAQGAAASSPASSPPDPLVERALEEILVAAVEKRFVTGQVKISDAEVEAFYQAHRAEFAGSERIVLRHVYRRLSVHASEAARASARAELEGMRREILAGADFETLARTRSDSQTSRFGGLIAPQARGQLEPTIEARVWRLAVGELSEVVETPIGCHIFRLEQRLPPQNIDPETARQVSRRKLTLAAEAATRQQLFERLLEESGARWAPERLVSAAAPTAVLFELGADRLTVAGLDAALEELPFVDRHTRPALDLLHERAVHALYLYKAAKERLAEASDIAPRLTEAEQSARREAALAARVARRRAALQDDDLRPLFAAQAERFAVPARDRVRVLVRAFAPGHSPHYYFEELTALAGEIRAGRRDFAAAARELSTDRSAVSGGDLGWIDLRDLGWWAGTRTYERVRELARGTVSEPLLVEVYDAGQLTDHATAYMLVRVEAIEPRRMRTFAEARDDVAAAWIEAHLPDLRREIEGGVENEPGRGLPPER